MLYDQNIALQRQQRHGNDPHLEIQTLLSEDSVREQYFFLEIETDQVINGSGKFEISHWNKCYFLSILFDSELSKTIEICEIHSYRF